jgi:hypothetical protein
VTSTFLPLRLYGILSFWKGILFRIVLSSFSKVATSKGLWEKLKTNPKTTWGCLIFLFVTTYPLSIGSSSGHLCGVNAKSALRSHESAHCTNLGLFCSVANNGRCLRVSVKFLLQIELIISSLQRPFLETDLFWLFSCSQDLPDTLRDRPKLMICD